MTIGELGDESYEALCEWFAMNGLLMFFTHELADALELIVNGSQYSG